MPTCSYRCITRLPVRTFQLPANEDNENSIFETLHQQWVRCRQLQDDKSCPALHFNICKCSQQKTCSTCAQHARKQSRFKCSHNDKCLTSHKCSLDSTVFIYCDLEFFFFSFWIPIQVPSNTGCLGTWLMLYRWAGVKQCHKNCSAGNREGWQDLYVLDRSHALWAGTIVYSGVPVQPRLRD